MTFDMSDLFAFPFILYWLIGLGATFILGEKCVKPTIDKLVKTVTKKVKEITTDEEEMERWDQISDFDFPGGKQIGRIGRLIYYFGFLFGSWIPIGAWLTFKVAVKWESWSNIAKVPAKIEEDPLAFGFVLRRYWSTLVFQRFIVGTGLNILYAGLGVFIAYGLENIIPFIFQNIK